MNEQYLKHVGYSDTNNGIAAFFSPSTSKLISSKVTELLRPLYPPGIIVPCERVVQVMNDIYSSYRPPTGDIFTRYNIPSGDLQGYNYIDTLINQTIQVLVTNIKDNLFTDQNNSKLDIWSSLYGTFNAHGLRQHPPIRTRERRSAPLQFNMNY